MAKKKQASHHMTIDYTNGSSYLIKNLKAITIYSDKVIYEYDKTITFDGLKEMHSVKSELSLEDVKNIYVKTTEHFADTLIVVENGKVSSVQHFGMKKRLVKESVETSTVDFTSYITKLTCKSFLS